MSAKIIFYSNMNRATLVIQSVFKLHVRIRNADGLLENKRRIPLTCMESRSFFNIKRRCSNVAGSAAVTHIQSHTWLALHLRVIEIPFTPLLLSLWESNMKWFKSVIKTGNEIRVCD